MLKAYFEDVEVLSQLLEKQLRLVLSRTLNTVRKEPTVIVTALRIIEREEKADSFALQVCLIILILCDVWVYHGNALLNYGLFWIWYYLDWKQQVPAKYRCWYAKLYGLAFWRTGWWFIDNFLLILSPCLIQCEACSMYWHCHFAYYVYRGKDRVDSYPQDVQRSGVRKQWKCWRKLWPRE